MMKDYFSLLVFVEINPAIKDIIFKLRVFNNLFIIYLCDILATGPWRIKLRNINLL